MSSWRNSLCLVLLLLLLVVKGEGVLLNLQSNGISIYSTSEDLTRIESILWSSSANKNLPSLVGKQADIVFYPILTKITNL